MTTEANRSNLGRDIAGARTANWTHTGDALAANNGSIAGLYSGYGKDAAALEMAQGNTLASLATGLGSNIANIRTGAAANLSNIATGAASNRSNVVGQNTGATTNLGTAGMTAGQQGNANAWNAGMQVANLAVDAATGQFKNPFGGK
jgi:hypothetical protein